MDVAPITKTFPDRAPFERRREALSSFCHRILNRSRKSGQKLIGWCRLDCWGSSRQGKQHNWKDVFEESERVSLFVKKHKFPKILKEPNGFICRAACGNHDIEVLSERIVSHQDAFFLFSFVFEIQLATPPKLWLSVSKFWFWLPSNWPITVLKRTS